jgi:hypothetical protein
MTDTPNGGQDETQVPTPPPTPPPPPPPTVTWEYATEYTQPSPPMTRPRLPQWAIALAVLFGALIVGATAFGVGIAFADDQDEVDSLIEDVSELEGDVRQLEDANEDLERDVDDAREEGFNSGYDQGWNDGNAEGYLQGYDQGWVDGLDPVEPYSPFDNVTGVTT